MKKFAAVVLVLAMCLALCSCQGGDSAEVSVIRTVTADDGLLYDQGLEHVAVLEEMLNSDGYLNAMTTAEAVRSVLKPCQGKEFGEPDQTYKISFSNDAYAALMARAEIDSKSFSEPLEKFVANRMQNSLMTMINSTAGAETLAATSILNYSNTYVGESLEQNAILLMCYRDICPVMVSFVDVGGAVTASSTLLLSGALTGSALEDVMELFGGTTELEGTIQVTELEVGH